MDALGLSEILLRGASAGLLILLAAVLLRTVGCCLASRVGALFALGTAAYTIKSSEFLFQSDGPIGWILTFLGLQCVTFFWWFANVALDDDFAWQNWHWAPFAVISALAYLHIFVPSVSYAEAFAQLIMLGLSLHVFWIALAERRHDLLEQRRHVRILFVVIVGLACLGSVLIEMFYGAQQIPQWLSTLQALEIFIVSLAFSTFLLQPATPLIAPHTPPTSDSTPDVAPADVYEMGRLEELMRSGFYTTDSLTISDLAEAVDIPEHRLRRLINQQLGFRNFTAYLNSHRLSDAKTMLSDPAQARRQITQIAFELGYGSITPFNRAFKAEQGMTPTEFRRMALSDQMEQPSSTH